MEFTGASQAATTLVLRKILTGKEISKLEAMTDEWRILIAKEICAAVSAGTKVCLSIRSSGKEIWVDTGDVFIVIGQKQTNMFRILHRATHLGMVVRSGESLFLARVGIVAGDEQLETVSLRIRWNVVETYFGAKCWVLKHDGGVAELLDQAVFALNC
jgi:hypothetical protein